MSLWAEKLAEVGRKRASYQDMAAEGLITFDELQAKLEQLEETREVASWELSNNLEYRRERIVQLEEDKAALLERYVRLMPQGVELLTGEERQRAYNLPG